MIFFSRFWPYHAFSRFSTASRKNGWLGRGTEKGWIEMRTLYRLGPRAVINLPNGKYADGGGLWLHKREDGGGQWVLRYTIHGRRREMGLGTTRLVSLKQAREQADQWRALLRDGKDPIKERDRERRDAARNIHLLKDIAADAFEVRKSELKGDGKAGRWFSPLELHVLPKLGKVAVSDLDQKDIRDVLAPLWHTGDTGRKALNRAVHRHAPRGGSGAGR